MKRVFTSLVLLLVTALLFPTTAFAKNESGKQLLVALGDSIPYGYNINQNNKQPSKHAFPYLIGDSDNLRVRNLSVPGWQSADLLNALQTDQTYRQAVRHADYMTLTIGSNDLLEALKVAQIESAGDPELFMDGWQQVIKESNIFKNIRDIITIIRTLTDAPIVVYNIYNPFQMNDPLHVLGSKVLPIINNNFMELTSTYNALFGNVLIADVYTAFDQKQAIYVLPNDIHPTIEGQIMLAEIGLDALN